MENVIIIKKCIHCSQKHILCLRVKKSSYYASGTSSVVPFYFKIFATCPVKNEDFSISTSIILDANTEFGHISVSKIIDMAIDWAKINTEVHYIYDELGVTESLKKYSNIGEFTLTIPPGGLEYGALNIIAIV